MNQYGEFPLIFSIIRLIKEKRYVPIIPATNTTAWVMISFLLACAFLDDLDPPRTPGEGACIGEQEGERKEEILLGINLLGVQLPLFSSFLE